MKTDYQVAVELRDICGKLRAENAELKRDAERWRTYLKVFAEEELVEAEWKGPEAITAYIDAAMKGQT